MDGREMKALKGLESKIKYIYPLLTMMTILKVSQRHLATLSGIDLPTIRKMIRIPSHGSEEQFEKLLNALLDYENKLKEEFPEYGY
ncbi:hypothetical protein QUQ16_000177 [Escherichia coli]|nr:hypothetical protein [Escherichia coli]